MAEKIRCVVVTPMGQVVDRDVDFVVVTAHDGQFGILPHRAPLLCKLAHGMLKLDHAGTSEFYFVSSGFAEVNKNVVTLITPQAIPAKDIQMDAVNGDLSEARRLPMGTPAQRDYRQEMIDAANGKRSTYHEYVKQTRGSH
jgi:F-type H+-transporting ATPase subunit epsilon